MNEVKRYDIVQHTRGMDIWHDMEEREDGDYVKFEDFELATKARDGVFSQVAQSIQQEKLQLASSLRELVMLVEMLADKKRPNQMRYINVVVAAKKRLEDFK